MPGRGRFAAADGGGVALMTASAGALMCALAAIVVDVGSLALSGRTLQGAADLAAMAAARNLTRAEVAARATAEANLTPVETLVALGRYAPDPALRPDQRFTVGPTDANAVRVTLTRSAPLYFGRYILGRETVTIRRTATAATAQEPPRAMFSIGSRLARLDGGIANQLLSGLTGSSVSLSVMDYAALADARVNLLGFSDALATELGVTVGDYDALLTRSVDAGRALTVLRDLAGDQGDSALSKLASKAVGVQVRLGDLIGLQADAGHGVAAGLDAQVSVLDLAMAMLETGGRRQVALAMGARAGVADLKVSLAIGERPNRSPWLTVTGDGSPIIRTAQARLYVEALTAQKLSGLAQVRLPVVIELASSEARLETIACPAETVTLGVRPGLAGAAIGQIDTAGLDDFTRPLAIQPATLLSVLSVVSITGSADIEAADPGFRSTRFSADDIAHGVVRTVGTTALAQGVVASLIQRLNVTVRTLGLGVGLGGLTSALGVLLAPIGPVLDAAVLPLLDLLGLKLGEADVQVHGVSCPVDAGRAWLVG